MIRYQSEQPTKNWRLGIKRAFVSFNPFIVGSFLGIMLIILRISIRIQYQPPYISRIVKEIILM